MPISVAVLLCGALLSGEEGDAQSATAEARNVPGFSFLIGGGIGMGSAEARSTYPLAIPRSNIRQTAARVALRGTFWELAGTGLGPRKDVRIDNINYNAQFGLRPIHVRQVGLFLAGRVTGANEYRDLFETGAVRAVSHAYTSWLDGGVSIGVGSYTGKLFAVGIVTGQAYAKDKLLLSVDDTLIVDDDQALNISRVRYDGIRVQAAWNSRRLRAHATGLYIRMRDPSALFEPEGFLVTGEIVVVPVWHIAVFATGAYSDRLRAAGLLNTSLVVGIGLAR